MCNSRVALYIDEIKAFYTINNDKKCLFVVILSRINEIALSDNRWSTKEVYNLFVRKSRRLRHIFILRNAVAMTFSRDFILDLSALYIYLCNSSDRNPHDEIYLQNFLVNGQSLEIVERKILANLLNLLICLKLSQL